MRRAGDSKADELCLNSNAPKTDAFLGESVSRSPYGFWRIDDQ
jgi:hypothetical protein